MQSNPNCRWSAWCWTLSVIYIILQLQDTTANRSRQIQWTDNGLEALQATDSCNQITFVSRHEWGAKKARPIEGGENSHDYEQRFEHLPSKVFIHQAWDGRSCNDIDSCSIRLQAIQAYHQYSKNWPDIGYNLLISGDGSIYEGIGLKKSGFHTLNYNHNSLGIALIGTFHDQPPTPQMLLTLEALLDCLMDANLLSSGYTLHGHRDARCTICPGDLAYSRLANNFARFSPGPLAYYTCPEEANLPIAREEVSLLNGSSIIDSTVAGVDDELENNLVQSKQDTLESREGGNQALMEKEAIFERPQRVEQLNKDKPQIVVVNLQTQHQSSSTSGSSSTSSSSSQTNTIQPMFYVLTKSKSVPAIVAGPTLYYSSGSGSSSSQQSGGQSSQQNSQMSRPEGGSSGGGSSGGGGFGGGSSGGGSSSFGVGGSGGGGESGSRNPSGSASGERSPSQSGGGSSGGGSSSGRGGGSGESGGRGVGESGGSGVGSGGSGSRERPISSELNSSRSTARRTNSNGIHPLESSSSKRRLSLLSRMFLQMTNQKNNLLF